MTLDEIEQRLIEIEQEAAELRAEAIRLPEVRKMPGAWVSAWLTSHGATPKQAHQEILAVLDERRAAQGQPPVGTCSRRPS